MRELVVVGPKGQVVCNVCYLADKPHTRMRGMIGLKSVRKGEGVLLRPMLFITTAFARSPIDAVFLDDDLTVVAIEHELKPWRLAGGRKGKAMLELAAGECRRLGVQQGDRLGWAAI